MLWGQSPIQIYAYFRHFNSDRKIFQLTRIIFIKIFEYSYITAVQSKLFIQYTISIASLQLSTIQSCLRLIKTFCKTEVASTINSTELFIFDNTECDFIIFIDFQLHSPKCQLIVILTGYISGS